MRENGGKSEMQGLILIFVRESERSLEHFGRYSITRQAQVVKFRFDLSQTSLSFGQKKDAQCPPRRDGQNLGASASGQVINHRFKSGVCMSPSQHVAFSLSHYSRDTSSASSLGRIWKGETWKRAKAPRNA